MDNRLQVMGLALLLLAGIPVQAAWGGEGRDSASVFRFDPAEVPGAKPWSSENFKNDPYNFQFAILGDRGGGASPLGTYERAIDQLNLLQPEFVMSVGDYVEGYTTVQAEMDEQWEEFEAIVAKLQMPFFYVRGNHDINMPLTRKA
ncbi:MAG: metallophosphoesterase [Deltaproteobacteria bacterium]|nr:metallophosphoesterase [Deltaproteobacteria bacterium]